VVQPQAAGDLPRLVLLDLRTKPAEDGAKPERRNELMRRIQQKLAPASEHERPEPADRTTSESAASSSVTPLAQCHRPWLTKRANPHNRTLGNGPLVQVTVDAVRQNP